MKLSGNTILVTGGGSGIGAGLARRWAEAGNTVIVAGRRQAALDAVAGDHEAIHAMALDVEDAGAIEAFARTVVERFPALNVLVNNAGVMPIEPNDRRRDLRHAEATVVTNLLGPIRLTNALIEQLLGRPDAAIVTVSSGLGFTPLVDAAVYSATKAAIHSWSVSLRDALKGRVEVIELVPPGVQTGLTPGQESRPGYMPLDAFVDEVMALFAQQPTPPEILVERVRPLRFAERDGQFDQRLQELNERARAARAASGG